jgi:hypothetical protein
VVWGVDGARASDTDQHTDADTSNTQRQHTDAETVSTQRLTLVGASDRSPVGVRQTLPSACYLKG